ncbi:hypothetical protein ACA910_017803 [Epithemia clementina (nom. ined.)]
MRPDRPQQKQRGQDENEPLTQAQDPLVDVPTRTNEEEVSLVGPMFLLTVALALFAAGSWAWGIFSAVLALVFAVFNASAGKLEEKDKHEIKFNGMHVGEIFKEMLRWEARYLYMYEETGCQDPKLFRDGKFIVQAGILAQIRKFKEGDQSDTSALVGQESVYLAFRKFGRDDETIASAFSFMALIAKNSKVREKTLYEADTFGLDLPIRILREGLDRAKQIENDEERELLAAELQRKGFLALGALSDGSSDMAQLAVQEGALDTALDAIDWFRCHAEVVNWTLWALFLFCYEHPSNKIAVIQCQGIPKIIEAMRYCAGDSLDVARHGVALLFDLMRDDTTKCNPSAPPVDIWRLRESARAAGIHEVLLEIMDKHSEASDVAMMGMELLAGTGYSKTQRQ